MSANKNNLNILESDDCWYKDGLQFKCTGCGKCCTGAPGAVWISDQEVGKISAHLGVSVNNFLSKYTRMIDGKRSLIEDPTTYDCVFLKNNYCTIYKERPLQCRTFPWWPGHFTSKSNWKNLSVHCEGINHPEGEHYSRQTVQELINEHVTGGGH